MARHGQLWFVIGALAMGCTPTEDSKDSEETDPPIVVDTFVDPGETDTDDGPTDTFDTTPTETETDVFDDTSIFGCPQGWDLDCNDLCFSLSLKGNDFCEEGPAPKPDFNCVEHNFDEGDCVPDTDTDTDTGPVDTDACPIANQVRDCNSTCAPQSLLGNDTCDNRVAPGVNFNCIDYGFDNGDCIGDSDIDSGADTDLIPIPCADSLDVRDCRGRCYYLGWVGDGTCDEGQLSDVGQPDFACDLWEFDKGDCTPPTP